MIRLLLATDSLAPSGMGEHILLLAEGLRETHDIVVAATRESGLLTRAAAAGFKVKRVGDAQEMARWLDRAAIDVAHVHAGIGWEGHGLAAAARAAGVPVVMRTEHLPYLLTDEDQRAEHLAGMADIDRLICVSDQAADSHRDAGIDAGLITVIRNGVAPRGTVQARDSLRRGLGLADSPILLMVARFTEQKAHALVLQALPAVLARHPDTAVLLAGAGPLAESIARSVARLGLAGCVRMLGERRDCAELMEAADLLLMPSNFEGMPLVLLEAMQAGLATVATQAPGVMEAVIPTVTGWLSPVGNAPAFAANIVAALDDPAARARFAEAGRARFEELFQADRMIDETDSVYRAMAAPGRQQRMGTHVSRTRIGFIGAGGIANRHFGVLEHFDDVTIAAICDTDMGRATEAAARFGAKAFTEVEAMLEASELDAVFICVPPFAHGAPERAVMARGLPFFVEKPISLDLATAEAIAKEVEARNIVTAVGYHWRYLDIVDEVRGLLSTNPARLMSGYWLDSTPPPQWWWREDRSGGQMLEQTTHLLDLARYLAGDVVRVYGMSGHVDRPDFPGLDVPTVSSASLLFKSGAIANFASTCLLKWNHRVGLHIFGDGLAIELNDREVMIDVGHGRLVRGNPSDPVVLEDRDFIDAVRGGENRIRCSYHEALASQRIALAVVESARTGRTIEMAAVRELENV